MRATRDWRQAHTCGLTYCTVGMPALLRAAATGRLKSGESMPTKTCGRRCSMRAMRLRRSLSKRGSCLSTSARSMTESSSASCQGSQPSARMRAPAMPKNSAPGARSRIASMRPAPSASPDASPATIATLKREPAGSRKVIARAAAKACNTLLADQAPRARAQRLDERRQHGIPRGALLEQANRLLETQALTINGTVSLADAADLSRGKTATLEPLDVDAARLGGTAGDDDIGPDVPGDVGE